MQLAKVRGEETRTCTEENEARGLRAAKKAFHTRFEVADIAAIVEAIRDSVRGECVLRDHREFGIPLSGELSTVRKDKEGNDVERVYNPMWMGKKHTGRDVRLESRRRLYALIRTRPDPKRLDELLAAIKDCDGRGPRGPDGGWLCTRGEQQPDPRDKTGEATLIVIFDGRNPVWLQELIDGKAAATAPIEAAARPDTCPDCNGKKRGRGYQHADSCVHKKVKAVEAVPV